jgi:hypothetical protein
MARLIHLMCLLLAMGLLNAQTVYAQSPRPVEANNSEATANNKYAAHNPTYARIPSALIELSPTPSLHSEAANTSESEYESAQYRLNRLQTWFNGGLVVFTAALVIVGGLQARRLRETVEATKDAAEAAKKSADVAEQAVAMSERPWVDAQDWRLTAKGPDSLTSVKFNLRNFGKSPAWISKLSVKLIFIEAGTEFPSIPDYTSKIDNFYADAPGRVIPAGETLEQNCLLEEMWMNEEQFRQILRGLSYLWLFGRIDYEDALKRPHNTGFSAQFRLSGMPDARIEEGVWESASQEAYRYHDRK